ncbi:sushi domain protein [Ancylostoma duodenale]|uniref:Sushi domain protein n=1 Tax=Ancylostoma duodenale TaxID=51022 RepID=A0A0C2GFV7_9BILA|nr:sushi domain protein [Ancylostoma duodenale]
MKMSDISQRGLRAALAASPFQKEFYWIGSQTLFRKSQHSLGVSSSLTDWRWADGTTVAEEDADWSNSKILTSNRPEAVVLARLAEWRWIPSAQNVWNSFLCQSNRCQICMKFVISEFFFSVVDCERPPSIPNGSVSVALTIYGSVANYTCQDGYRLIGHATVSCGSKGVWEPAIPVCYDMATLRELKADSAENHAGLAALIVVLGLLLVFAVLRFSRASKSVPISEKVLQFLLCKSFCLCKISISAVYFQPAPPYGAPNVIYAIPSVITNPSDSVVYYAPSAPLTKMELPPHLVSLKPLPSGHFQATMPIGRW